MFGHTLAVPVGWAAGAHFVEEGTRNMKHPLMALGLLASAALGPTAAVAAAINLVHLGELTTNHVYTIDGVYAGDGDPDTGDIIYDKYLFTVDSGAGTPTALANLAPVSGILPPVFKIFRTDAAGNYAGGDKGVNNAVTESSTILLPGLTSGQVYALWVSTALNADDPNAPGDQSSNLGKYALTFGFFDTINDLTAVPLPPAGLLALTGFGALFGLGRLRKKRA
jgi:hypothetical protein